MYVYFSISEDKLLELQRRLQHPPGERPEAAPPFQILLADGSEYRYPGRLNFVDAAVDAKTGTLTMRVAVANPDRYLRPGLFVRVRVPALQRQAITVRAAMREPPPARSLPRPASGGGPASLAVPYCATRDPSIWTRT
jgi:membrane fusion protein (multidrug efflux system)